MLERHVPGVADLGGADGVWGVGPRTAGADGDRAVGHEGVVSSTNEPIVMHRLDIPERISGSGD